MTDRLGSNSSQGEPKHFRANHGAAPKPGQVLSHQHLRRRRDDAGHRQHPRLPSVGVPHQILGAAP
jgi:hypothetical protein